MTRYGTLRTWAVVLKLAGFFAVIFTIIGSIIWAFEVDGVWQTLGVIFLGAPIAIFISTWARSGRRSTRSRTSATRSRPDGKRLRCARRPRRAHRRPAYAGSSSGA